MIAPNKTQCPTEAELVEFLIGRLPADRFESLAEHIDACDRCRSSAVANELKPGSPLDGRPGDSWLATLAEGRRAPDPILAESECQAVVVSAGILPGQASSRHSPRRILGGYRLIRPLGRGGMGTVFLAEHQKLKRRCAIKFLHHERRHDEAWRDRFEREMRTVASLSHPNLIAATDAGEDDGWHYLVMEYLEGLDLASLTKRVGPVSTVHVATIGAQAARGLAAIHAAGLVHRDVKPSNILLATDGVSRVLDLGLAADAQRDHDLRVTTVGQMVGTVLFAAPEQIRGIEAVDARADLYGLGGTLFQLMSGQTPFDADQSLAALAIEKASQDARRLRDCYTNKADQGLAATIDELLARDRSERPASAVEVAEKLEEIAGTQQTQALRKLVRHAMRVTSVEATQVESVVWPWPTSHQPSEPPTSRSEGSGSRDRKWAAIWGSAAAMLGAVAVLSAIMFSVQTDKGTLVIESPLDEVTLRVTQRDEPIQEIDVTVGANVTALRSGQYNVELSAGGDRVRLSEDVFTILRGEATVLKIRTNDALPGNAVASRATAQKTFRDRTLSEWLRRLRREYDPKTIQETVNAIVTLVDENDSEAIQTLFVVARRLGSFKVAAELDVDCEDASAVFMRSLRNHVRRLPSMPLMTAITKELQSRQSNSKSEAACLGVVQTLLEDDSLTKWASMNRESAMRLDDQLRAFYVEKRFEDAEPVYRLSAKRIAQDCLCLLSIPQNRPLTEVDGLKQDLQTRAAELSTQSSVEERVYHLFQFDEARPFYKWSLLRDHHILAMDRIGVRVPPDVAVLSLMTFGIDEPSESWNSYLERLLSDQPERTADELMLWLSLGRLQEPWDGGVTRGSEPSLGERVAFRFMEHGETLYPLLARIAKGTTYPLLAARVFADLSVDDSGRLLEAYRSGRGWRPRPDTTPLRRDAFASAAKICRERARRASVDANERVWMREIDLPQQCEPIYQVASPDESQIAFVGRVLLTKQDAQQGLFVQDRILRTTRCLIESGLKTVPAWSPDSTRIAIRDAVSYGSRHPLLVVDVSTGKVRDLGVQGVGAVWSPDGKVIAATSQAVQGGRSMVFVPSDGTMLIVNVETGKHQFFGMPGRNEKTQLDGQQILVRDGGSQPVWSPSGMRLAWTRCIIRKALRPSVAVSPSEVYEVWTVNADGSDARRELSTKRYEWTVEGGKERVVEKLEEQTKP